MSYLTTLRPSILLSSVRTHGSPGSSSLLALGSTVNPSAGLHSDRPVPLSPHDGSNRTDPNLPVQPTPLRPDSPVSDTEAPKSHRMSPTTGPVPGLYHHLRPCTRGALGPTLL